MDGVAEDANVGFSQSFYGAGASDRKIMLRVNNACSGREKRKEGEEEDLNYTRTASEVATAERQKMPSIRFDVKAVEVHC